MHPWIDLLKDGSDFLAKRGVAVAGEVVAYGVATHAACIVALVVAISVVVYFSCRILARPGMGDDREIFVAIASPIFVFSSGIALCLQINWFLMAWLAPRLYLIEYFKEIAK